MKRFFLPVVALLFLAFPLAAHAGRWVNKEIFWKISSVGSPSSATAIYVRDTSRLVAGGANLDTTGEFTISNASALLRGEIHASASGIANQLGKSGSDTTTVGYLIFATDSAASGVATLGGTAFNLFLEGRAITGGIATALSGGWIKVDSLVMIAGLATNPTVVLPVRSIGPYGPIWPYEELRARFAATVGLLPAARAFWRYYDIDER